MHHQGPGQLRHKTELHSPGLVRTDEWAGVDIDQSLARAILEFLTQNCLGKIGFVPSSQVLEACSLHERDDCPTKL